MLYIAEKCSEISQKEFLNVYSGSLQGLDSVKFWEYMEDFFTVDGALCCVWKVNGVYHSALRLEPYQDGLLLTGLETAPQFRRQGSAKRLLETVSAYLMKNQPVRLYSHIDKRNKASLELHRQCGFTLLLDYAKYIDGTVSANGVTMVLDIKQPDR